jgi:hypothetical protein
MDGPTVYEMIGRVINLSLFWTDLFADVLLFFHNKYTALRLQS